MRVSTVAVMVAALVAASPAPAQSGGAAVPVSPDADQRARELYLRGDRLYSEGDYEGAVAAFSEAYELSKRPALLYNLANAYERLGRHEQALHALREFVPQAPEDRREVVLKRIKALEQRVEAERRAEAAPPAPASPPPSPAPPPAVSVEPAYGAAPADSGGATPWLGYALVGVGAVGVGLGTVFGLQALSARSDAEDLCPEVGGGRRCSTQARDSLDEDSTKSLLADVSFGVGIVSAAVGVTLVLTSGSSEELPSAALRASPREGGGEVGLVGRF